MNTEILSLQDLCDYLKVSKPVAYKLVQRGKIPSFKIGRRLRFRKSKVDAWIESGERQRILKVKQRKSTGMVIQKKSQN